MDAFIRPCHGTLSEWLEHDPVLAKGEVALVATDDTKPDEYNAKKVGDGKRKFSQLPMLGYECLQTAGESTLFPMSQDATTKAIKAGAQDIITQTLTDDEDKVPSAAAIKGTITSEVTSDADTIPSNKAVKEAIASYDRQSQKINSLSALNSMGRFTDNLANNISLENGSIDSNGINWYDGSNIRVRSIGYMPMMNRTININTIAPDCRVGILQYDSGLHYLTYAEYQEQSVATLNVETSFVRFLFRDVNNNDITPATFENLDISFDKKITSDKLNVPVIKNPMGIVPLFDNSITALSFKNT